MEDPSQFESSVHIVAHLLREIESAIREVLLFALQIDLQEQGTQNQNKNHKHEKEIEVILSALEISETDPIHKYWLKTIKETRHKLSHRAGLKIRNKEEIYDLWYKAQLVFYEIIQKFRERYSNIFEILDKFLDKKDPTNEDLKNFRNKIPHHPYTLMYFYNQCNNPVWLNNIKKTSTKKPLLQPEARYLTRMAEHRPELVRDIIMQMPETDNVQVLWELADAVLNMPPDIAATLINKCIQWINAPYFDVVLAKKLGNLIEHLIRGNQFKQALLLAENLLDFQEPKENVLKKSDTEIQEPQTKIDNIWHYKEILSKNVPALTKTGKLEAFNFFCKLLDKAVKISIKKESKDVDFSYIWRSAIEDHPQNIKNDVKNVLVDAVRDAADLLVKESLASLDDVIKHLESYPYPIFKRIILYLLWRFPEKGVKFIPKYLINYELFSNPHFRHEYTLLLRKAFCTLSPKEQKQIFKWIEDGPKPELLKEKTPEERESYKKRWLYRELARFNFEDLPERWQKVYKELVEKFGEPEQPDLTVTFTEWVGPTSPLTVEDILKKDIDDLVKFLKTWEPPQTPFGEPSPEGLGRALSSAVAKEPERFAREAGKFKDVHPTYVRYLIQGFTEALKEGKAFSWEPIFELCQWAVSQPRNGPTKKKKPLFGLDSDWDWTRRETASMLETGFEKNTFPFELREQIWKILELLTEDPEPTPEDEREKAGQPKLKWPTIAINSVRGKALHAVIRYALWVRKHLEKSQEYHGFDSIPEVKAVLEKHLNPSYDSSRAIRSIYGQWFPWLVYLDHQWARKNVSQIFPIENPDLRNAAWEIYLTFNKAYKEVFDILREQYAYSVDQLESRPEDQPPEEYEKNLAEHLMTFYSLGLIDFDDAILEKFWEKGGPLRKEALEFIGRAFYYTDKKSTIERFKQLWEKLWKKFRKYPNQYKQEIASFGWWFITDKFEDDWAFLYLPQVFEIAGAEIDDFVIQEIINRFTLLVNKRPREILLCLKHIFEADQQGWHIYFSRENIKTILSKALSSPDDEVVEEARRLINYLGSRGYFEFRELLKA